MWWLLSQLDSGLTIWVRWLTQIHRKIRPWIMKFGCKTQNIQVWVTYFVTRSVNQLAIPDSRLNSRRVGRKKKKIEKKLMWSFEWVNWCLLSCMIEIRNMLGPLHLCWFFTVGPFNTWLISSREENKCCYKLSNWQNKQLFSLKMTASTILSEIVVILCIY